MPGDYAFLPVHLCNDPVRTLVRHILYFSGGKKAGFMRLSELFAYIYSIK
jgi:hypothetical protein